MSDQPPAAPTPGPWKLIWYNNATYPFPLSVHTEDDCYWIARDGTTSSEANARLIVAAPETAAERDRLVMVNAVLFKVLNEAYDALLTSPATYEHVLPRIRAALDEARKP
jgi:hypothetical protein